MKRIEENNSGEKLLSTFDGIYSKESFLDQADEGDREAMRELSKVYSKLLPRIKQARNILTQAIEVGVPSDFPSAWWEDSVCWEMALAGNSSGLADNLDELINFKEISKGTSGYKKVSHKKTLFGTYEEAETEGFSALALRVATLQLGREKNSEIVRRVKDFINNLSAVDKKRLYKASYGSRHAVCDRIMLPLYKEILAEEDAAGLNYGDYMRKYAVESIGDTNEREQIERLRYLLGT